MQNSVKLRWSPLSDEVDCSQPFPIHPNLITYRDHGPHYSRGCPLPMPLSFCFVFLSLVTSISFFSSHKLFLTPLSSGTAALASGLGSQYCSLFPCHPTPILFLLNLSFFCAQSLSCSDSILWDSSDNLSPAVPQCQQATARESFRVALFSSFCAHSFLPTLSSKTTALASHNPPLKHQATATASVLVILCLSFLGSLFFHCTDSLFFSRLCPQKQRPWPLSPVPASHCYSLFPSRLFSSFCSSFLLCSLSVLFRLCPQTQRPCRLWGRPLSSHCYGPLLVIIHILSS